MVLRALILVTGAFHLLEGAVLYGILCFGALALILAPSLVVRSTRLTIPVEIERASIRCRRCRSFRAVPRPSVTPSSARSRIAS